MACPAAATCLRIAGSYVACNPIGKKIALVQCAARAASTAEVFFGHGPSSKVSTTSPSRRKSWLLKCSKPKPGPPVVSISTTRGHRARRGCPDTKSPRVQAPETRVAPRRPELVEPQTSVQPRPLRSCEHRRSDYLVLLRK